MKCPHCQVKNPENALNCSQCKKLMTTATQNYQWSTLPDRTIDHPQQLDSVGTSASDVAFEPLPVDALLSDRYRVLRLVSRVAGKHIYDVRDILGMVKCPSCGVWSETAESSCRECGTVLKEEEPYHLYFHLIESAERGELGLLSEFVGMNEAKGLFPVFDGFSQYVAGQQRYYLVKELWGQPFASSPYSKELGYLFFWGEQLAKALELIHRKGWAFPSLSAENICVDGNRAQWFDYSQAVLADESQKQANLLGLVDIVRRQATGNASSVIQKSLPRMAQQFFQESHQINAPLSAQLLAKDFLDVAEAIRRPSSITFHIGRASDVGKVRQLNEDSVLVLELSINNQSLNRPIALLAVADGIGGHDSGEIASGLTLHTLASSALSELLLSTLNGAELDYEEWLTKAIRSSNDIVYQQAQQSGSNMGTTIVVAVVVEDHCYIAHAGDSRAYHINATQIRPLTTDHSLVARLLADGTITPDEVHDHPQSNVVYRTLGNKGTIDVDTTKTELSAGDFLLLCSDGLTGLVEDKEIQEIVIHAATPQIGCDQLVVAANLAGGSDNITVAILKVERIGNLRS